MESVTNAVSYARNQLMMQYTEWLWLYILILAFGLYVYLFPTSIDFFTNPRKTNKGDHHAEQIEHVE